MRSKMDSRKLKLQEIERVRKEADQKMNRLFAEVDDLDNECNPIQAEFVELNANLMSMDSKEIKNFSEKNSLILGEKMGCLKNVEDSQNELFDKLAQQFATTVDTIKENDLKTKNNLQAEFDLVSCMNSSLNVQLNSIKITIDCEVTAAANGEEQKGELITDLIKNESSRSLVKAQEVKSMVQQTLSGLVNTAELSVCDKLVKCSNEITQFEEEGVLKYKSTGKTPVRKDYKFDSNLAATSPHTRIIKRFRLIKGLNDTQLDSSIAEVNLLF